MKTPVLLTAAMIAALAVAACDKQGHQPKAPSPHQIDPDKMQQFRAGTYNWCDVFSCEPCPRGMPCPPPGSESIIHCCNEVGYCIHVELMGDCDPSDYIVICDWGQSNVDGSITCYE